MQRGAIVIDPNPGWAAPLLDVLLPGAHAVVLGRDEGIEARRVGFEVRDTILVLGGTTGLALILRKPIVEKTVAEQVVKTDTGAIWIDGCRVEGGAKQASAGSLNGYGGSADGHYEAGTGRDGSTRTRDDGRRTSSWYMSPAAAATGRVRASGGDCRFGSANPTAPWPHSTSRAAR